MRGLPLTFAAIATAVTATAALTTLTSLPSHATPAAQSSVTVSQLTTEYGHDPLGIGVAQPRLSWQLSSPKRAQKQTAYEIIVASSLSVLAQSRGDVWDSGKVTSSQSLNVTYAGPALASRTRYYWEVRIWDGQGLASAWSTPNWWETALLSAADWGAAQWIGPPVTAAPGATVYAPMLRKEFTAAAGAITRARAYITGLGDYTLDINGHKVGDRLLDPAWTQYEKTVLYATYDVTSDLRSGQNAIAVELAPGFYYYNTPKLLMLLVIDYAGGASSAIVSDNTWQLDKSGPTSFADSGGTGEPVFGGESYDARRFPVGWDQPGFAAAGWAAANVLSAPGGLLVAETEGPVTVAGSVTPVRVTRLRSGSYVADMGQTITGWVNLTAAGHPGQTVSMQYGEKLNADGSVNSVPAPGPRSRFQRDQYTFAGSATQSWEPSFTFKSFRYVQLTGLAAAPKAGTVIGRLVHTAVAHTGSFTSSDPLYNQIHQAMQRTILNGLLGSPAIDPANERSGWTADIQLLTPSETDNYGMDGFLAQWLDDVQDSQRANGSISVIDPVRDGCCYRYAPEWTAAYPLVSWDLYVRYGDIGVLRSHYDSLTKYMQWQLGSLKNAISPASLYGDWSSPGFVNRPPEDRRLSATAYVYQETQIMAGIAGALGHAADAASYRSTAASIKTRFNALFLNTAAGKYRTVTDPGYRQTNNAIPLEFGMVPNQYRAAVLRSLVNDVNARGGHLNTGILGTPALLDVLTSYGLAALAQKITNQTSFPSWGQWIKAGADTMWEEWGLVVRSRDQPTLGTVDAWFYEDVAGISPDPAHPGYQNSIIKPRPMAAPSSASASIGTPYGQVKSSWTVGAAAVTLNVQVPGNATATVEVPLRNCSVVTESGVPAAKAVGVRSLGRTGNYAGFSVGSGAYDFKCTK
jgi:alpha-L-rhamnosidase